MTNIPDWLQTMRASFEESHNWATDVVRKKYMAEGEDDWRNIVDRIFREFNKADLIGKGYGLGHLCYDMVLSRRFIPGGSILGSAGMGKGASLSNCYVIGIEEDSIEGIFDWMRKAARTFSWRGGVGVDITVLRPKMTPVNNAAVASSGAVSFLPMFSEMVQTISQLGRRGALMASIDCRHPDVLDFVRCKSDTEGVFGVDPFRKHQRDMSGMNISVKLTDAFMRAVKNDDDWHLEFPSTKDPNYANWKGDYDNYTGTMIHYKTIRARDLMDAIAESAVTSGDPGVLFWDAAKNKSTGMFDPKLYPIATNP